MRCLKRQAATDIILGASRYNAYCTERGSKKSIQKSAEAVTPGLLNFITTVDYHFCPSLPAAFTQPGAPTLADLCRMQYAFFGIICSFMEKSSSLPPQIPLHMHRNLEITHEGKGGVRRGTAQRMSNCKISL